MKKNNIYAILIIIGGILLILSGISINNNWFGDLLAEIEKLGIDTEIAQNIVNSVGILSWIASSSGAGVIIGGLLIAGDNSKVGNIIIDICAGTGSASFIIDFILILLQGAQGVATLLLLGQSMGWIGTLLVIVIAKLSK